MLIWLKDNGPVIGALAGVLVAIVAVLQLVVVRPMNRHFDAQDRYIEARFDAVDQRIDDLETSVNQRFDQQDKYMNARFDAQDERLDLLTNETAELGRLIVGIIERVSRNEGQIDFLREQLQTIDAPAP